MGGILGSGLGLLIGLLTVSIFIPIQYHDSSKPKITTFLYNPIPQPPIFEWPTMESKEEITPTPAAPVIVEAVSVPGSEISKLAPAKIDTRPNAIRKVMAGLPISDIALEIVETADRNGVDWRLIAAIGWRESTGGKALTCGINNWWGWGPCQNFVTPADGAQTVARGLSDNKYSILNTDALLCRYKLGGSCDGEPTTANYLREIKLKITELELAR